MNRRSCLRSCSPWLACLATLPACGSVKDPDLGHPGSGYEDVVDLAHNNPAVDKIDLLLMIDNSPSMADKQQILASTVPELVERFTNPVCVDRVSRAYVGTANPGDSCGDVHPGSVREFAPIEDIHIGVITSSLGGHGADSCSDVPTQSWNPRQQDMAHLVTRGIDDTNAPVSVDTYQGLGFLDWDPTGQRSTPPGESDVQKLKTSFTYLVRGAGQDGCGFEASLEAWRRFLVDPAPYEKMAPAPCYDGDTKNQCRGKEGVDQVVLTQRKDFLRKDSVLAVIMLTDENDCSVIDDRQFFLALQALDDPEVFHLAHGTNACLDDPWDANCKSCWEVSEADFPECSSGWANPELDDALNLRCFNQKRRFGIDFLYPVRRYIDALSQQKLDDGTLNPLFCQDYTDETRTECAEVLRDRSLVFLAGIVGVPWQDLARDPSDLKQGYRPAELLSWTPQTFIDNGMSAPNGLPDGKTLWNMILGEVDEIPGADANGDGQLTADEKNQRFGSIVPTVDPLDPLMRESVDPRTGVHPITGVVLLAPGSGADHPVNASERNIEARDDLQYACVFERGELGPLDCALPENALGCDCAQSPENPLCWNGAGYTTQQYRAKAYPGRRQLAVLKGMDSQAIVASVCPANLVGPAAADFGYRPAITAIVDRLKWALQRACLAWRDELAINEDGTVSCVIFEASKGDVDGAGNVVCPPCVGVRSEPSEPERYGVEHSSIFTANKLNCLCRVAQVAPGEALKACTNQVKVADIDGWCYVDPEQDPSHNFDVVASCPVGGRRTIRFVGDGLPAAGALELMFCDE